MGSTSAEPPFERNTTVFSSTATTMRFVRPNSLRNTSPGSKATSASGASLEIGEYTLTPPTNAHRRAPRNNDTSPTVRPRLMPQTVRLPLGVTACVLPAGMYLCRQNDYVDRDDTMQRLLGALSVVPQRTITREDEIRIAKAANAYEQQHRPDQQREPGPFMEPFAVPRDHGDPTLFDFVQPLEDRDLPKLTLPVGMALAPEDGCVILHTDVPAARAHGKARQELQVLIDAQNVSTPPPEPNRIAGIEATGAASAHLRG